MSDTPGKLFFVDTNLVVYSVDPRAATKHLQAQRWMEALWSTGDGRLSWQVLNEFYATATRKVGVPTHHVRTFVVTLAAWQPVDLTLGVLGRAWQWMDSAQLSYWDALIVAAAEVSGCDWLLTEDLQDQRKLGPVTIINPFRVSPEDLGLTSPE